MDQKIVSKYGKKNYSLEDVLRSYGLKNLNFLNGEHEDHQTRAVNRYITFYRDETADGKYFFPGLHGWTRLNGRWVANKDDYGAEADDTHLHEVNGHLQYETGDEGFVRAHSEYLQATGKKPNPYMNSV